MIQSLYSVVVNCNLKEDTLVCVESLVAAGAAMNQVIVVDNGSTDGSAQTLRQQLGPALRLIESNQNLGFAGGNNLGIQYALSQGAEWVLLLNNDTYVATTFLAELENAIKRDKRLAIIGPMILYHNLSDRVWYLGDRLIPGLLISLSLYREHTERGQFPSLVPVDFISGCGMLIRRDVFETIGFFDASLFMYGEDVDFCWRARMAGFRLAATTRAKMWHKVSASANRDQPLTRYLRIRNQIRFYRVYSRGLQLPAMVLFTILRAIRVGAGDLLFGQPSLIYPLVRGWYHGWFNQMDSVAAGYGTNSL